MPAPLAGRRPAALGGAPRAARSCTRTVPESQHRVGGERRARRLHAAPGWTRGRGTPHTARPRIPRLTGSHSAGWRPRCHGASGRRGPSPPAFSSATPSPLLGFTGPGMSHASSRGAVLIAVIHRPEIEPWTDRSARVDMRGPWLRRLTSHERRRRGRRGADRRAGGHRQREPRPRARRRRRGGDRPAPGCPTSPDRLHDPRPRVGSLRSAQPRRRGTGIRHESDRGAQRAPGHGWRHRDAGAVHAGPGGRPSPWAGCSRHEGRRGRDGAGGRGASRIRNPAPHRPGAGRRRGGRQPRLGSGHRRTDRARHPAGRLPHRGTHRPRPRPVVTRVRGRPRRVPGPGGAQLAARPRR